MYLYLAHWIIPCYPGNITPQVIFGKLCESVVWFWFRSGSDNTVLIFLIRHLFLLCEDLRFVCEPLFQIVRVAFFVASPPKELPHKMPQLLLIYILKWLSVFFQLSLTYPYHKTYFLTSTCWTRTRVRNYRHDSSISIYQTYLPLWAVVFFKQNNNTNRFCSSSFVRQFFVYFLRCMECRIFSVDWGDGYEFFTGAFLWLINFYYRSDDLSHHQQYLSGSSGSTVSWILFFSLNNI